MWCLVVDLMDPGIDLILEFFQGDPGELLRFIVAAVRRVREGGARQLTNQASSMVRKNRSTMALPFGILGGQGSSWISRLAQNRANPASR